MILVVVSIVVILQGIASSYYYEHKKINFLSILPIDQRCGKLPQLIISAITPIIIFVFVAFLDLPVASILLIAAMFALFLPTAWHKFDTKRSLERQEAYAAFASDFLDGIQGLATLKSF